MINRYMQYCKITNLDELEKNVKRIEILVRHSYEYRCYLAYMKETLEKRCCSYFKNIDFVKEDMTLELHHIITLYDLVMMVGSKMILDNMDDILSGKKEILTFDIAREVLMLHLEDKIPVVMLSKTIHEMVHSGLYQIPKNTSSINLGNYSSFIKEYKEYISKENLKKYEYFGVNTKGEKNV